MPRAMSALCVVVLAAVFQHPLYSQPMHSVSTQRDAAAMRQPVYRLLRSARDCVRDGDLACAEAMLAQTFALSDLNSYERAQAWYAQAGLEVAQTDMSAAAEAYEAMLAESDAPAGLVRSAHYALAQLYLRGSRLDDAQRSLDAWWDMAQPSAPEPFILRAEIAFRLGDFAASEAAVERALAVAAGVGRETDEAWYRLRYAARVEMNELDRAAEALEEMLRRWPGGDKYLELARLYARLGDETRRRQLYEEAYAGGWIDDAVDLIALADVRLGAGRLVDALNVLEQNLERGYLTDGDALRFLIARVGDWAQGEPMDPVQRETLVRNARREQRRADVPRNLRL